MRNNRHCYKSFSYIAGARQRCIIDNVTCIFQVKTSSRDTNIRAEAEIEVVRCTIQERGDGGA